MNNCPAVHCPNRDHNFIRELLRGKVSVFLETLAFRDTVAYTRNCDGDSPNNNKHKVEPIPWLW